MAPGTDVQQLADQLLIIPVVTDQINLGGVDNQQWRAVIEVEKLGVGIAQAVQIVPLDPLLEVIATAGDALA